MISSGVRRRYKINTDSLDAHQFIRLEKKYEGATKPPSVITQEQTRKAHTQGAVSSNGSEYYKDGHLARRIRRASGHRYTSGKPYVLSTVTELKKRRK